MGKQPTESTIATHNVVLNRVFDEAVMRGLLTDAARPKLEANGKRGDRRPAFDLAELRALLGNFEAWIERARTEKSKELRHLLRDYVETLVDTGARPGDELLNLKWKQIDFKLKPTLKHTGKYETDDDGDTEELVLPNLNRSLELVVSGKTGRRTIVAMGRSIAALQRIAMRNYGYKGKLTNPFAKLTVPSNNDYVFRTAKKEKPTSFQNMFEDYLTEHNLRIDPRTGQKRVFYSLRHTYATLALTTSLLI